MIKKNFKRLLSFPGRSLFKYFEVKKLASLDSLFITLGPLVVPVGYVNRRLCSKIFRD